MDGNNSTKNEHKNKKFTDTITQYQVIGAVRTLCIASTQQANNKPATATENKLKTQLILFGF